MAETKSKKTIKVIKKLRPSVIEEAIIAPKPSSKKSLLSLSFVIKLLLVVLVGAGVFLLVQKNRSFFIAGTVNKSPVFRWELNSKMSEKYGTQAFEEIVSERLLAENLKKNNITITDKEVQDELAKIKLQYGGEEQFKAAIAQFGMTEAKAIESIKQSIGLKKIIEKNFKVEITEDQVKKYFDDNKTTYTGKKLEEVSTEIKDLLLQQEIYTKSQEWYTQIRKEAKVDSFI